ncbi:pentraxin-related protein PTX3 [Canis lupus baileyi]|uniref:Pentraxin-related protein PTX3 n=2 Tax=Canis lupus familiaris TaxID=9615 RepID=A0A8C0P630_CANLF|nr:pentraxin-related protein PTX3 [Canis lupus familiaris]XP_025291887.1 pentraxin-related protein PTX3 [Canis lupus dingo]XP_038288676.1 pentraxin-related protein PTX3 [Canis lupus familiaris]XP_038427229.1 pentraxin-related protein PTX3 [Canis lupus familiaris]
MRLPAVLLCALCSALSPEGPGDYELMYVDLDNEIDHGLQPTEDPPPCACRPELSRWDKLFIMLEDWRAREGTMLQAADAVLRAELRSLRAELGRLGTPCAPPTEGPEPGRALGAVLEELRRTRADLRAVRGWAAGRWLPAGCETAILFPMRSRRIFGSVHPVTPMKLESFSACIWVKATDVLNKTVLFSYGTKRNPYEIQLYLSYQSVVLVVGGEHNKLVANAAVPLGKWTRLCGTWESRRGRVSLWVDGEPVAAALEMATGHLVPEGGILQIGQEKNGCCVGGGFDEALAFSGRLTGFNIWDRVLGNEEIRESGGAESCHIRGNVVGWGVTEVQPHGGAQYVS